MVGVAAPPTASLTWRAMSLVATDCSSMALATVFTMPAISSMTLEISSRSTRVPEVEFWIAPTLARMSSVASAVWRESSLISCATTENPFPALPAIVAFKASKRV